jgi:adenine-specific DNA methylase
MLDYSKSFIETQFPVSKISKESYKERKAGASQTLTPLGKWWGRKPLILVRATILGVLFPVSDNLQKDREIFLKVLMMDETGLLARKVKNLSINDIDAVLNENERKKFIDSSLIDNKLSLIKTLSREDKDYIQRLAFNRLSYDEKLNYCERPEAVVLNNVNDWEVINQHLKTNATTIQELISQLGMKRFGHKPKVGDCFAGGGSIPFESARIGANVFASDLNPMASLLTWASLNILGAKEEVKFQITKEKEKVLTQLLNQIDDWGIEKNENGDIANSYLYCNETICPECGFKVPLSSSWWISKSYNAVAILEENDMRGFDIHIISNASKEVIEKSKKQVTQSDNKLICPHCLKKTPISSIRNDIKNDKETTDFGIRKWESNEFIPRDSDVFQERLYAIRYISTEGRYYKAPDAEDLAREQRTVEILSERFKEWQNKGYIPSNRVEEGEETSRLQRERGWQYWHQLFNPRQLLVTGLFSKLVNEMAVSQKEMVIGLLGINRMLNWNSKLCIWNNQGGSGDGKGEQVFANQALNTLYNYSNRGMAYLDVSWNVPIKNTHMEFNKDVLITDARKIEITNDIWITDPPYADAVHYHELTEFFLAWDKALIEKAFPEWYTDSKRVLAVKGTGEDFNKSMVDVYKNLANHMPDNGYQVVMFTHQDVKVWSELSMILWSAGLRVVSAWNVATETESGGLKQGAYVKGTVLLTLTKQNSNEMAFQDELYDEIKHEVKSIIDSMKGLDDKDDPDFTDADYLLASYASSLKVLTKYKEIEGIDVAYWLNKGRDTNEVNPVEELINKAVRIAYDYLIPEGFDKSYWKDMKPEERFFIRGIELEINKNYKISSYQELARGFGVAEYKDMFAEFKANNVRLKTPTEYGTKFLGGDGFGDSLVRHLLVAIKETKDSESTIEGRNYLKNVYQKDNQYWYNKPLMIEVLNYLSRIEFYDHMDLWNRDAYYARVLKESLKNEGV